MTVDTTHPTNNHEGTERETPPSPTGATPEPKEPEGATPSPNDGPGGEKPPKGEKPETPEHPNEHHGEDDESPKAVLEALRRERQLRKDTENQLREEKRLREEMERQVGTIQVSEENRDMLREHGLVMTFESIVPKTGSIEERRQVVEALKATIAEQVDLEIRKRVKGDPPLKGGSVPSESATKSGQKEGESLGAYKARIGL